MEQKQISSDSVCDQFPPLSAKYPWFVAESLEAKEDGTRDQLFFTIHSRPSHYQCRIPELSGKRIRGFFHGWVVLSNHPHNVMWSLWDPRTSKTIHFPPLNLKEGDSESIGQCCLSSPPDDPSSVLLLTRTDKPTFVFCRLDRKRKKLSWTEMSYTKQLKRLTTDGYLVHGLTYCNGKVYALNTDGSFVKVVSQVDIVVTDREVVIRLLLFGACPFHDNQYSCSTTFLKGYCTELFCIVVDFNERTKRTVGAVSLFKVDMTSIVLEELEGLKKWDMTGRIWEELAEEDFKDLHKSFEMWEIVEDLKNAIFFVDLARDNSVFFRPAIRSELGGYIHIRSKMGKTISSYNLNDKTISRSSRPSTVLPTNHVSVWECRLEEDHREAKFTDDSKQEDNTNNELVVRSTMDDKVEYGESRLLNLQFHLLWMIMEFCVGVEYMNVRATCKLCYLAAPMIQWRDKASVRRLQNYSLDSPWLMVVDEKSGIITFTDPWFGDKYFMKTLQVPIVHDRLYCSRFGWLLFYSSLGLVFYNPFTKDIHELPDVDGVFRTLCFSAPPTSPDCMVVGFTRRYVYIHFVAKEQSWRQLHLNFAGNDPYSFSFPTFCGRDLYALCNEGELHVFEDLDQVDFSWKQDIAKFPSSCCTSPEQYFLTKCGTQLLLISVGECGESVDLFKLNDSTKEWEKINCLGGYTVYVCDTICLCIEAKIKDMENKIYFPQLHPKNGRIVFYSLETRTYYTFNRKDIQESFLRTSYELYPHLWIEPSGF